MQSFVRCFHPRHWQYMGMGGLNMHALDMLYHWASWTIKWTWRIGRIWIMQETPRAMLRQSAPPSYKAVLTLILYRQVALLRPWTLLYSNIASVTTQNVHRFSCIHHPGPHPWFCLCLYLKEKCVSSLRHGCQDTILVAYRQRVGASWTIYAKTNVFVLCLLT